MQMSEDRRRRRIRGGAAGRVGEPNVLSNAATPNALTGMVSRPTGVQIGTREGPATWLSSGTSAPRSGVRLPSFGTLIFLGFLAITGFRLLGEFAQGLAQITPEPTGPVEPARTSEPAQPSEPGSMLFGRKADDDCGVLETGLQFEAGTSVWWSAQMSAEQDADASVVVIVHRDGVEVDREDVPPDPDVGRWSVLCSGAPVLDTEAGVYRVEVWDASITTMQAAGEYRVTSG
jgi:hypothetical protein